MKEVLLVDYENVQNIDLKAIKSTSLEIKIFVGKSQNKIPFELVSNAQTFGERIEWIKIDGNGNNALDFHIAYYLGKFITEKYGARYIILSKDKGFDPLVRYINNGGNKCQRINSILELNGNNNNVESMPIEKIIQNLKKIQKNKRPRSRRTLITHISNLLKNEKDVNIDAVIDTLFMKDAVSEENKRIKYNI